MTKRLADACSIDSSIVPTVRMAPNLIKCPNCDGTGKDGFNRCYPPGQYTCSLCNGKGEITDEREFGWSVNWHLLHNRGGDVKDANERREEMRLELINLANAMFRAAGVKFQYTESGFDK